ncbi:hypothetical protein QMG83_15345 [Salinibacterium sp. G-O1]|uniref:hypothetical protein n=1 Tax=Salinibacterium sp. G-O1 TaxID=3046208 RepID=UPI0024BB556D|nr:hypothetical protein [Salinibacterium sp. G-O1]MDJ0336603.1 hypothetical protein [Salinibacterium sp. G-O1]
MIVAGSWETNERVRVDQEGAREMNDGKAGGDQPSVIVRARAVELARRLNLLQDAYASGHGDRVLGFSELRENLSLRGVNLSEGRWTYMLSGDGPLTTDSKLLTELAAVFEVDPSFLLDWDDPQLPARILAQRELVQTLRRNKLTRVAARSLGPLTPESLQAISQMIDSQMARDFGSE